MYRYLLDLGLGKLFLWKTERTDYKNLLHLTSEFSYQRYLKECEKKVKNGRRYTSSRHMVSNKNI